MILILGGPKKAEADKSDGKDEILNKNTNGVMMNESGEIEAQKTDICKGAKKENKITEKPHRFYLFEYRTESR